MDEAAVSEVEIQRGGSTTLVEGSRAHHVAESLRLFDWDAVVQFDFCF